jgi:hypothetical protein
MHPALAMVVVAADVAALEDATEEDVIVVAEDGADATEKATTDHTTDMEEAADSAADTAADAEDADGD